MTPEFGLALTATAGGLLAVLVAGYQSLLTRRQRVRDFEMVYVQRYWTLIDRIRAGDSPVAIELYLELCEDEADMRQVGQISDSTWSIWLDGMVDALGEEPYASRWIQIAEATHSLRFHHLRTIDGLEPADRKCYEPLRGGCLWRWWRGLYEVTEARGQR